MPGVKELDIWKLLAPQLSVTIFAAWLNWAIDSPHLPDSPAGPWNSRMSWDGMGNGVLCVFLLAAHRSPMFTVPKNNMFFFGTVAGGIVHR